MVLQWIHVVTSINCNKYTNLSANPCIKKIANSLVFLCLFCGGSNPLVAPFAASDSTPRLHRSTRSSYASLRKFAGFHHEFLEISDLLGMGTIGIYHPTYIYIIICVYIHIYIYDCKVDFTTKHRSFDHRRMDLGLSQNGVYLKLASLDNENGLQSTHQICLFSFAKSFWYVSACACIYIYNYIYIYM